MNYSKLDEAWSLVESEIKKGTLKKDIAPLLNERGYRTLKNKAWTYQTLMLEQRRRSQSLEDVKTSPSSSNNQENYEDVFKFIQNEIHQGKSVQEVVTSLNEKGIKDPRGRNWNYQSLVYQLGNQWIGREDKKEDNRSLSQMLDIPSNQPRQTNSSSLEKLYDQKLSTTSLSGRHSYMADRAWEFIKSEIAKGTKKKKIVSLLNYNGFKTRNGKAWTYQTLMLEQKKRKHSPESETFVSDEINESYKPIKIGKSMKDILTFAESQIQKLVVEELNRKGRRTKKGRLWTYRVLLLELMKQLDSEPESELLGDQWWKNSISESVETVEGEQSLFDLMDENSSS